MRTITRVAIRLIIIFVFLQTLLTSINTVFVYTGLFSQNSYHLSFNDYLIMIGMPIIFFIILAYLWLKTDWLVNVFAGRVSNHELVISTSNIDLMKVGVGLLGAYFLIDSISSIIGLIGFHIVTPAIQVETNHSTEVRNFLTAGVKLITGILLFIGAKRIFQALNSFDDKIHMRETTEEK